MEFLLVVYNLEHLEKRGHGHHAKVMLWWSWFCELGLLPREYVIKNTQCHITYRASITCSSSYSFHGRIVSWSLWRRVVLCGQGFHICVHMWLTTYLNHVGGYGFCYVINMSGIYTNFWSDLFVVGIEVNVNKVWALFLFWALFFFKEFFCL